MNVEELDAIRERVRAGLVEVGDPAALLHHLDDETARQRIRIAVLESAIADGAVRACQDPEFSLPQVVQALTKRIENLEQQLAAAQVARLSASQENEKMQGSVAETMGVADQMFRHIALMEPVITAAELWTDNVTKVCGGPPDSSMSGPAVINLYSEVLALRKALQDEKQ